jgi:hypothetical protein
VEGPDVSNSLFIARPATSTSLEYQTKFRIDDFAIFYRFMTDQEVQGILFEGLPFYCIVGLWLCNKTLKDFFSFV